MKKSLMSIMIVVGSYALLTTMAMAKGHGPDGAHDEQIHRGMPNMIAQLDLTPDQVDALKKNRKTKQRKMIDLRAELAKARLDMGEALEEKNPNRNKIQKIAARLGQLHEQKVLHHAESIIYLKSILTEEQREKMEKLMLMQGNRGLMGRGHGGKGHRHRGRE